MSLVDESRLWLSGGRHSMPSAIANPKCCRTPRVESPHVCLGIKHLELTLFGGIVRLLRRTIFPQRPEFVDKIDSSPSRESVGGGGYTWSVQARRALSDTVQTSSLHSVIGYHSCSMPGMKRVLPRVLSTGLRLGSRHHSISVRNCGAGTISAETYYEAALEK